MYYNSNYLNLIYFVTVLTSRSSPEVVDNRKNTYPEYRVAYMLEAFATGELLLIVLAVLAGLAIIATALKFAVKIAIRLAIVAAVVLGGIYAAGVLI